MKSDVVDLIMNDHRELEKVFDQLLEAPDTRPNLVPVMITMLAAHSRAEEADVYPAARDAGIDKDVEHSQKEHLEADQLALKLSETPFDAPGFEATLKELVEAVSHHLEEEESTVLPGLRENLSGDRLEALGEAFLATREEHLGETPADMTKAEMDQQAENAEIGGTSRLSKSELRETLEQKAER